MTGDRYSSRQYDHECLAINMTPGIGNPGNQQATEKPAGGLSNGATTGIVLGALFLVDQAITHPAYALAKNTVLKGVIGAAGLTLPYLQTLVPMAWNHFFGGSKQVSSPDVPLDKPFAGDGDMVSESRSE